MVIKGKDNRVVDDRHLPPLCGDRKIGDHLERLVVVEPNQRSVNQAEAV